MFKKLLGMLAVIGTIVGALMGAKKSKELKELEGKIDESKKEEKGVETKIAKLEKNKKKNKKEITSLKRKLTISKKKTTKMEKTFESGDSDKAADFLKTPQGRELQERIARRTARATAANVPAKTVMGTVKKAIKKHGSKKVVQMLAKRMGVRGSIMLLSKLGLAGVMQAAPVAGQIAGGLLLAADAVWIVNTLSDLAE